MDWMKLIPWLFYNVVLPLVIPLATVKVISWFLSKPSGAAKTSKAAITIFSIIKDGQVFFYCTALASVAIGDLKRVPAGFDTTLWVIGLLAIIILSTVCFAAAVNNKDLVEETRFGWCSVTMAITAILAVADFRINAGLL